MDAFRQKSVRVLGDGVSERWGRPRTDALRLKSVRALEDGASERWGRPRTDALRQKSTLGLEKVAPVCKNLFTPAFLTG